MRPATKYWRPLFLCNYDGGTGSIRFANLEALLQVASGVRANGTAGQPTTYNITTSGGVKVNGTIGITTAETVEVGVGGVKVNGTSDAPFSDIVEVGGGVRVNGSAAIQETPRTGGGVKVNGSAVVNAIYNYDVGPEYLIPIPMLPEAKNRKPGCQPNTKSSQYKGLAGWWINGEPGGSYVYDPVGNNTGTTDASNWVIDSGRGAKVIQLNAGDYINCGHGKQLDRYGSDMTVSVWTNPASYPAVGYGIIVRKRSDYEIALDTSGNVCYRFAHSWGSWTNSGRTVSLNTWTLVTLTLKNGVAQLYLNGRTS
jgi:hypothetical protein